MKLNVFECVHIREWTDCGRTKHALNTQIDSSNYKIFFYFVWFDDCGEFDAEKQHD